jgi:hypothetical protein
MLKRLKRAVLRPRRRRARNLEGRPQVRARRRVSQTELAALGRLERIVQERKSAREGQERSAEEKREK